jgi:hypothetical protein
MQEIVVYNTYFGMPSTINIKPHLFRHEIFDNYFLLTAVPVTYGKCRFGTWYENSFSISVHCSNDLFHKNKTVENK